MSKIAAVTMVKDEADVIEDTVRHVAATADFVVVADNRSTDGTREILEELEHFLPNLAIVDDPEVGYYQSAKMSSLAARALEDLGPCWIVPFDADEVWLGLDRLRDVDTGLALWVPGFDYLPPDNFDPNPDPFFSMTTRRSLGDTFRPKVIPRSHPDLVICQGNHAAELHGRRLPTLEVPGLSIAHFPLRSFPQFSRKVRNGARAYEATNLPTGWGAHWRKWGAMSDDELRVEWGREQTRLSSPTNTPHGDALQLIDDPVGPRLGGRVS